MADFRDGLHAYFSAKANAGLKVTVKSVAQDFKVEEGGAGKAMSILTGNGVLVETDKGEFDCARVLQLTKAEFASAASQGKDTTFIDGLWKQIVQLKKNNDILRSNLEAAKKRVAELEKNEPDV